MAVAGLVWDMLAGTGHVLQWLDRFGWDGPPCPSLQRPTGSGGLFGSGRESRFPIPVARRRGPFRALRPEKTLNHELLLSETST